MEPNAIQQVFTPATQRLLIRLGLILVVVVVLAVVATWIVRKVRTAAEPPSGAGTDGTPGTTDPALLPQNLKKLADDLKASSGWSMLPCNALRCDTLAALAELPNGQLQSVAVYYITLYGTTLQETFDSFYLSGCCFRDGSSVLDAKLEALQDRVKTLNI